jgi:predicted MFS family arabinose efflux permease
VADAGDAAPGPGSELLARATKYGWLPLLALAATVALESGERQSLSQAVDGIQHRFHVSDSAVGWLPFAMALIGVLGAFPIGILADRMKRTLLLAWAVVVWTVCMGLNGLASSYALLFAARLGVGAVEANGPAAVSLLSDYYPVKDRARMMGLYQAGALVGAIVGLVAGGVAVQLGGYRWAFWMWIPFGVATALFLLRMPEPRRGDQDAAFEEDLALVMPGGTDVADLAEMTGLLPKPIRVGTLDYERASPREVGRELLRIPSMWFGVMSITISQLLLSALQFWAVPYFKRVHHLGAAEAGAVTALLGVGAVFGILGGGFISDRYLRKGYVNARVYVVAISSIAATAVLLPAFISTTLTITIPFFFLAGVFLTLPVAPAEALTSDVVVAQLRGRASAVRSVVRAISNAGPAVVGLLSGPLGLRMAIVAIIPLYAVGGVVMLFAAKSYPRDVAFVVAESKRSRTTERDAEE